jgi:hypothetical protein
MDVNEYDLVVIGSGPAGQTQPHKIAIETPELGDCDVDRLVEIAGIFVGQTRLRNSSRVTTFPGALQQYLQ